MAGPRAAGDGGAVAARVREAAGTPPSTAGLVALEPAAAVATAPSGAAQPTGASLAASAPAPVQQTADAMRHALQAPNGAVKFVLNPPELGRVEIRMLRADGDVRAVVRVERPEALEMLRAEFRGLERALADLNAGRTTPGALDLDLAQDDARRFAQGHPSADDAPHRRASASADSPATDDAGDATAAGSDAPEAPPSARGLDIRL